uniref:NADH:ubiquinone reductase (H(+)-translocating) n=1 Tax=Thaparocleidus asoti TaxID=341077 RepID=A0A7L8ZRV6_9PLAT|nr:NADH dehydrogenase subunit 5 [Thaparocleidus asoti]QOI72771.1 NADH dehydrogenase subunit 5 [Thaparocleidus asoti]
MLFFFIICCFSLLSFIVIFSDSALDILSIVSSNIFLNFSLNFSYTSIFFYFMLIFCSFISLNFSNHYFNWSGNNLNKLILLFLLVMFALVITNDLMLSLIFWEYLGFVSFILILYYSNYDTLFAANATLITSRLGDCGLFFLIAYFLNSGLYAGLYILILVALIVVTKSAIFPLSSWLLEAMRAPTPVSSLVHSSTLVTAGVWFLLNYGWLIIQIVGDTLIYLSLISIILSALGAVYYKDLKKIIALSTCNNVSWCIVYYIFGCEFLCLVQLVTHGIAKCSLFICIGDLLSCSYGSQNYMSLVSVVNNSKFNWLANIILVFLVCGVPLNGVYFSKHLLLISINHNVNIFVCILLFVGVFLSYCYSGRLVSMVSYNNFFISNNLNNIFYLMASLVVLGSLFNGIFVWNSLELGELSCLISSFLIFIQLGGLFIGYLLANVNNNSNFISIFLGQDLLLRLFSSIYMLNIGLYNVLVNFRFEVYVVTELILFKAKFINNSVILLGNSLVVFLFLLCFFIIFGFSII